MSIGPIIAIVVVVVIVLIVIGLAARTKRKSRRRSNGKLQGKRDIAADTGYTQLNGYETGDRLEEVYRGVDELLRTEPTVEVAFIMGDLERFHYHHPERAGRWYQVALNGIVNPDGSLGGGGVRVRSRFPRAPGGRETAPELHQHIINRIEGFVQEEREARENHRPGRNEMPLAPALPAARVDMDVDDTPVVIPEELPLGMEDLLLQFALVAQYRINEEFRNRTLAQHGAEEPAIRNDPQNVHEREVGWEIRDRYHHLRGLPVTPAIAGLSSPAVLKAIEKYIGDDTAAKRTLAAMSHESPIMNMGTDTDVLVATWKHIGSNPNSARREQLRAAVKDALRDAGSGETTVCVTGRAARIIGAMVLLDDDPRLREPIRTEEVLREEIFNRTPRLIQSMLTPEEWNRYQSVDGDPEIEARIRGELPVRLRAEYSHTSPDILERIITIAVDAV